MENSMDPLSASMSSAMKRFHPEPGELIAELRARPCLWDRDHAHYRQRGAKERAWREVCAALDPTYHLLNTAERHELGIIIMRKWYNIRDAYRKTYTSKHSRPYVYGDLLTFLDPGFRDCERAKREYSSLEEEEPAEKEEEEWLNVFEVEEETPPKKRTKAVEYNTSSRIKDESDESLVSLLVNLLEKEEDEDRAFFKSITPTVKALSDEDKFVFRIQVMKLLNSLRKKSRTVKIETVSHGSDADDE